MVRTIEQDTLEAAKETQSETYLFMQLLKFCSHSTTSLPRSVLQAVFSIYQPLTTPPSHLEFEMLEGQIHTFAIVVKIMELSMEHPYCNASLSLQYGGRKS